MPPKVRHHPKRPKRPKRPKHVRPNPISPKPRPKPRPKPLRPKPRKTRVDELTAFLNANPTIANAIKWYGQASPPTGAWQRYPTWSTTQKAQLAYVYRQIRRRRFPGLSPTPSPTYFSSGVWEGVSSGVGIGFDDTVAWEYFLAYVAHSLVVEITGLVPWSLKNYSAHELDQLLTTNHLFEYNQNTNLYLSHGATPGDPLRIYQFLYSNSFIGLNRRETIGRLLDWCRANMSHFVGSFVLATALDHWQYNGYPPVERVISGTTHPQDGFNHWTAGCWGTTSFLYVVLRTVNIPVKEVSADGHTTPHFMSEGLYLSHGDDPYDRVHKTTPPIPIDELFIDQTKFTAWFDPSLPSLTQQDNVARRGTELALEYLTDYILKLRCNDILQGVTNEANSSVYKDSSLRLYKFYTVSELQTTNLWGRLDARITARGGCSNIFPSPITAAITAPASGSTVSGPVTVNMAVSGQTVNSNVFNLKVDGNQVFNHAVAGLTDSYTWNTTTVSNGAHPLTLTVTDAVSKTATTSISTNVAN